MALAIPLFLIAGGIALTVSEGMFARQGVQLAADLAAQADAIAFGSDVGDQHAATAASAMNGANASAGRTWNAGARTLSAGQAAVTIGPGLTDPSGISVAVSVARPVPMAFSGLIGGGATRTVTTNAIAKAWNLPSPVEPAPLLA